MVLPPTDEFLRLAAEEHLAFEPGELERMGRFLELLLEANRAFNLTAITDPAQAWRRHVFDALTLLPLLAGAERVCDLGSGGGLPGMVLAIALPAPRFTLVEATGKKATFLRHAAERLELSNVAVVQERGERVGHDPAHRAAYDAVTARALGPLRVIVELAAPLLRVGGLLLAVKGQRASEEVAAAANALHLLGCGVAATRPTPTGTIVVVEKRAATAARYPRPPGDPARAPL